MDCSAKTNIMFVVLMDYNVLQLRARICLLWNSERISISQVKSGCIIGMVLLPHGDR